MRNPHVIGTALAVVLGLGAASAVQAALDEAAQKSFDSADVDGDGKVSAPTVRFGLPLQFQLGLRPEQHLGESGLSRRVRRAALRVGN